MLQNVLGTVFLIGVAMAIFLAGYFRAKGINNTSLIGILIVIGLVLFVEFLHSVLSNKNDD